MFGIALYADDRFTEAISQFTMLESSKLTDEQRVNFYYYKAKTGMELCLFEPVKDAWLSLLDIPGELVPAEWIEEAREFLSPPTGTNDQIKNSTSEPSSEMPLESTDYQTPTKTLAVSPTVVP